MGAIIQNHKGNVIFAKMIKNLFDDIRLVVDHDFGNYAQSKYLRRVKFTKPIIANTAAYKKLSGSPPIRKFLDEHPSSDHVEHKNCNGLEIVVKEKTRPLGRGRTRSFLKDRVTLLPQRVSRMQESLLELRSRLVQREREKEFPLMLEEQKHEFDKRISLYWTSVDASWKTSSFREQTTQ